MNRFLARFNAAILLAVFAGILITTLWPTARSSGNFGFSWGAWGPVAIVFALGVVWLALVIPLENRKRVASVRQESSTSSVCTVRAAKFGGRAFDALKRRTYPSRPLVLSDDSTGLTLWSGPLLRPGRLVDLPWERVSAVNVSGSTIRVILVDQSFVQLTVLADGLGLLRKARRDSVQALVERMHGEAGLPPR